MSLFSILTRPLFVLVAGIIVAAGIITNYGYEEPQPWPPAQGGGVSDSDSCYRACTISSNSTFSFVNGGERVTMTNYCSSCTDASPSAPGCWHDTTLDTAKSLCCELLCGSDDGKTECYRRGGTVDIDTELVAVMCGSTEIIDTAGTSGGSGGGESAGTSGGSGGGENAGTSGGSGGGESAGTSGGSGGGDSAGTSGGSGGGESAGTSGGSGGSPQGIEQEGCSTHCNSDDVDCYNISECEYEKYEGSR